MKALTVWSPWAEFMIIKSLFESVYPVLRVKDIENRKWKTTHRGEMLIHVGKQYDSADEQFLEDTLYKQGLRNAATLSKEIIEKAKSLELRGNIIGAVDLKDVLDWSCSPWADPITWNWNVKEPIEFENKTPAAGMPGLWEWNGMINWTKKGVFLKTFDC